ncbi:YlzJ-like family protein [Tepidibacillus decaturensis]|nr:YlzJ-like family protein [Tepidibacillus decaturensis]
METNESKTGRGTMIFYSTIPIETVFDGFDQMKLNYKEVQMGHMTMVVEPTSDYQAKIVRLISPVAQDYLNPKYQPGQTLYFNFSDSH